MTGQLRRPGSLVETATLGATAVTALALALAGLATGVILHVEAIRERDQLLATAIAGEAHPPPVERWSVEGDSPVAPIPIRIVDDPAMLPGLPAAWLDRARGEEVVIGDLGEWRVMLSPLEEGPGEHQSADPTDELPHRVIGAVTPRVRLAESVAPFALAYLSLASLAALGAAFAQRTFLGWALRPLEHAADATRRVTRFGRGERLPIEGPAEIRALPEAVNALLDRLDDAWLAQSRFTAEAAHELRTPVAALRGEVEVALRRPRDAEAYKASLERIAGQTARVGGLIEALLALAKVDAGQVEADRERVHFSEIVFGALKQEQATLAAAGCTVKFELAADGEVDAHLPLTTAAVANLLRNEARHVPGGEVTLRVDRIGPNVAVIIEDHGPGIPEAQREAVFDRFVRGANARAGRQEGLGLGLPLAREVARRHGGDCVLGASRWGGLQAIWSLPVAG